VLCLVLEGFAFLLRNNICCLGLWGLKTISTKLKIHPLFGKDGCYDIVNPLNILVIKIPLTAVLYGIYCHGWFQSPWWHISVSRMVARWSCCRVANSRFGNCKVSQCGFVFFLTSSICHSFIIEMWKLGFKLKIWFLNSGFFSPYS